MAQPRGRRRIVTLGVFLLAALTLLVAGGPLRGAAASAARTVVSPFVAVVRGVTKPIGEAFAGAFNYSDVVAQNHVLANELGQLRMQEAEAPFENVELHDLLALEHLPFVDSLPVVAAQLNAQNLSDFAATIEIDKGSTSGVLPGMPVVGAGGLVGIVASTTSGGATVTLITDPSESVGVTFGDGNEAVLRGQGASRDLVADFVAPGTPVHAGEVFYTDGLQGGSFPPGIPVGVLQTSATSRGATQLSISVAPAATLSGMAYVDVVKWEPGS